MSFFLTDLQQFMPCKEKKLIVFLDKTISVCIFAAQNNEKAI